MKNANLKKIIFALVLAIAVCIAATGCMNRAAEAPAQPSPTPNYMPRGMAGEDNTTMQESARFDWTANAAGIEEKIRQISEVADARVVVTDDTALVGVRFNQAYRGNMTERIREMIAAEVMAADPQITTVAVTADEDDVEDVYEISDRVRAGRVMDSLREDISEIVRNATTLR